MSVVRSQRCEVVLGLLRRRSRRIDHRQIQPVQQLDDEQAGHAAVEVLERMNVQQTSFGKGEIVDEPFAGTAVRARQSRFEVRGVVLISTGACQCGGG